MQNKLLFFLLFVCKCVKTESARLAKKKCNESCKTKENMPFFYGIFDSHLIQKEVVICNFSTNKMN